MELFKRFDKDGTGEMDTKELLGVVTWLGYACDVELLDSILREVDVDGSGSINEREFLVCMRKVRDREIQCVKDAIAANDQDGSGTISGSELGELLKSLGYIPDPEAVAEAARDGGIEPDDDDLDLSEC